MFSPRILRCAQIFLLAVLFSSLLPAQEPQSHQRGLTADTAYQLGEIDTVNLFNGNVVLTLPIGLSLPVGPELSAGINLVYNSNGWAHDERTCNDSGEVERYAVPIPEWTMNAGFGWTVNFGRLFAPYQEPENEDNINWMFLGPDGSRRNFYTELHPGQPSTPQADTWFSRDGTYLRMKRIVPETSECTLPAPAGATSGCYLVEYEGQIHEFRNFPTATQPDFRVVRMRDLHGNYVDVEYPSPNTWRLRDMHGRVQIIRFNGGKVQSIEVTQFGTSAKAIYTFEYTQQTIERQRYLRPDCATGADEGLNVTVDFLTRIVQPDGSYYEMSYYTSDSNSLSGGIETLRLPSGGKQSWTYQQVDMPTIEPAGFPDLDWSQIAYAVATKSIYEDADDTTPTGTWTYDFTTIGNPPLPPDDLIPCYHTVTVEDPQGNHNVHYFAASRGRNNWAKGLPFTFCDPHNGGAEYSSGPYLSQEIYEGEVAPGNKVRSIWVSYDSNGREWNPRLRVQRVVFHDDGDRYKETRYDDFDGLGNYRRITTTGNFNGTQTRTVETDYPSEFGTLITDPTTSTELPSSTFSIPSRDAPWVFDVYSEKRVTESGSTSTSQYCFDRDTGFLSHRRMLAGGSPGSSDILQVFEPEKISDESTGRVATELVYGGDNGGALDNIYGSLCDMSLPAQAQFQTNHTYDRGVLASSIVVDACDESEEVKILVDQDIDQHTGLVKRSRDSAGVATDFGYDAMGRQTSIRPPESAWTHIAHEFPTTTQPNKTLRVTTSTCPAGQWACGTPLSWARSTYDGLGRRTREERQYPGTGPNEIVTDSRFWTYNALGWTLSESVWGDSNKKTVFSGHDRFGRVGTIQPPGANPATELSYDGERAATRKVWITTQANGTRSATWTTELYDTFGRLASVCETQNRDWNGSCAGFVETRYTYNEQDNLTKVCSLASGSSCGQERRFTYDNRGFLTGERHPELGSAGNGWIYYTRDARGNVLTKTYSGTTDLSLSFSYDPASRLIAVYENTSPTTRRPLKQFFYARSNDGDDLRAGKLVLAKRYNWVDILAPLGPTGVLPVVITEAYEYKGRDGAVSKQQTRYHLNATTYAFETSFGYDPLGNVDEITYPQCLHHTCSGRDPPRQVQFNYQRGFLREVEGFANYIAYHSGGMLRRVPHGNVSDWIDIGTDGLARPYKIRTQGVVGGDWDSGAFVYDGAQNIQSIGGTRFAYDRFSRMIRGDVDLGNGQIVTQEAYYDGFGNVQKLVNNGVTQWASTSSTNNHLTIGGAQYDAAGNLTDLTIGSVTYSYDYDPFNLIKHLRSSDDESRVFIYNASDERILTFDCAANVCANSRARETWTLRGLDGKVLRIYEHPWDRDWSWQRDYVYRDGQLLAVVEANQIHHFHLDHLGTPRLITDASGNRVAFHAYYPFGLEATDPSQSEFQLKFTGHERDENGPGPKGQLDYMMARYCSPVLGRFYSVDSVLGKPKRPQSWNRYAYATNNPINRIDPDGRESMQIFLDQQIKAYLETGAEPYFHNPTLQKAAVGVVASAFAPEEIAFVLATKAFQMFGRGVGVFSKAKGLIGKLLSRANDIPGAGRLTVFKKPLSGLRTTKARLDFRGPANSVLRGGDVARGANAGTKRAFVTDEKGQIIREITLDRVKQRVTRTNPSGEVFETFVKVEHPTAGDFQILDLLD